MSSVDALGNILTIGDRVAFAKSGYTDLIDGRVTGFTAKKIRISHSYWSTGYPGYPAESLTSNFTKTPSQVVFIL